MPIAAAIGAAGSIGSALIGSSAASSAANAQIQAQQQVMATLQRIIGPIIQTGQGIVGQGQNILSSALGPLTALLTPGPNQTAALSKIPGFTFAQDWGQKAVQNIGTTLGLGGNTIASGAQYATGLAQQGFGQIANLLLGLGNVGQGVLNSGLGTMTNAAGALSGGSQSALSSIGNAQASGILGSANAINTGLGGVSNAALLYGLSGKLGGSSASGIGSVINASGDLVDTSTGNVLPG